MIFTCEIWEQPHQNMLQTLQSNNTYHLLCSVCPFTGRTTHYKLISHKPLSKQLTKLCKLISSDGPWETFILLSQPSKPCKLLWHARLEYQCSLLPLMFPQSIFRACCIITGRSEPLKQLLFIDEQTVADVKERLSLAGEGLFCNEESDHVGRFWLYVWMNIWLWLIS